MPDKERISALAKRINETSNADFVKRLLDAKRKTLKNDDGTVSTHELCYVTEKDGAVVFPSVQSVNDSLARFPYPESYERAVERGDTVHMSIPDAELFTKGYKEVYPGFKQYRDGGDKDNDALAKAKMYWNPNFEYGAVTTPVSFVTGSGPYVQLSADGVYGSEIEPDFMIVDRPKRVLPSAEQLRTRMLRTDFDESVPIQRDSFSGQFASEAVLGKQKPVEVDLKKAPVTIPQRDTASYFVNTASRLVDETNRFSAKGKTRDEIIAVQRELADAGYYSSSLSGKSKDEIKTIQTKLINKGLLSNRKKSDGTYAEADGIVGERTKAAWNQYNVDGKWGVISDEAYKTRNRMQGNGDDNKWENDFREGVDGCARWVTQKYESVLGNVSGQNGVFGNAWQMPKNIVRKGGTMLFNIYDEGFNEVSSTSDLKRKTKSKLSKNKPDLSILQPGDVVGIFFPNSSHHGDVLRDGTTYNTHVGMIVAYDDDGTPIVQHNMGGDERKDRADKLPWGSQITVAARPATSGTIGTYPWQMGESKYEVELPEMFENMATEESRANLKAYMDSMAGGADTIGKIYTNADMDAVQRIAIGVLGRETGFMQNTESSRTGKAGARVKAEKFIRSIVRDENPETKSSDLSKFKLSNLSANERVFLGIQSPKDLEKPEKAGLASMYVLAKNYDYFVRYAKENPQLGLTKQDIEDLTALSYNQGMGKLYSVGSVEFNGERRVAPGVLETIREAAASDDVIDDFSATKLGRIAHEYPMLTGIMREMYNHGIGNRSSSYMNAARQAIQNIKAKKK